MSRIEIADLAQVVAYGDGTEGRCAGCTVTKFGTGFWTVTLDAPLEPSRQIWLLSPHASDDRAIGFEILSEASGVLMMRTLSTNAAVDGQWAAVMLRLPNEG